MNPKRYCCTAVTFLSFLLPGAAVFADSGTENDLSAHRVETSNGVVAADNALASQLGAAVLDAGGNAADAGVTTMLALGVVHPFSSGLGGGGFCLYRDVDTEETTVLDFREMAPGAAHRDLYIVDGQARPDLARHGGLAVGVPGEAGGIWALHGRFGTLAWEDVVEPARELAEEGFEVGSTLATHLAAMAETLENWPDLAAIFQDEDGQFLSQGDTLVRQDLGRTLSILRDQGVRPFYVGPIADALVEAAAQYGGILTAQDLANYRVIRREPVIGTFRGYEIHAMPPPSSGGVALIQALNILEALDLDELDDDQHRLHIQIEALKHAFADRAHWLGDSDFVDVPVDRLIDPDYAAELAARIGPEVLSPEQYGTTAPDPEEGGTSHLSIIDGQGNMLACTTTINTRFGSLVHLPEYGIILNNEMADFNIQPGQPNLYGLIGNEQNAVEAGKRPLSSMSPTLVLRDTEPVMSLGGSGGPTIISSVYFTLLHTLLHGLDPWEAILSPRIHHQWMPPSLFVESEEEVSFDDLRQRGHEVEVRRAFSAVQVIFRRNERWVAVSDHRKGGLPAAAQSEQ